MSQPKLGNPAVVGLAGFGLTTLLLQFVNLGWMAMGPVVWTGLIFGGAAQLVAGLQEMKTGNNFGYCAFTSYGAFWIALCGILLGNEFGVFKSTHHDLGLFMVAWTLFTLILWVGALKIHGAMATTFTLLVAGFVILDIELLLEIPALKPVAGVVLIACAFGAWYMMARAILNKLFGREVLPAGKPWIR